MAKKDKDEPKTISVASRAHTSINIVPPPQNPDKPGLEPIQPALVLHGTNHPAAANGEMVNHNVDADIFRRWHEHHKAINSPIANQVREVPPDHQAAGPVFGYEAGLAAMTSTEEGQGSDSTVTHGAPVEAWELAATSDTPAEDTPRSEPDVIPRVRTQKSASQTIADELAKDPSKDKK